MRVYQFHHSRWWGWNLATAARGSGDGGQPTRSSRRSSVRPRRVTRTVYRPFSGGRPPTVKRIFRSACETFATCGRAHAARANPPESVVVATAPAPSEQGPSRQWRIEHDERRYQHDAPDL